MDLYTINYIKNTPEVYNYLRENSYLYKELNRNPLFLKRIESMSKERYKLRMVDKLEHISENINLISTFIDVLK